MVDYSKWDNIEISDDEDDTHPMVDKQSLFKWRHEERLKRMADLKGRKEELMQRKEVCIVKANEFRARLRAQQGRQDNDAQLQAEIDELDKHVEEIEEEAKKINQLEQKQPLNVDTISQPGFQKTVINKEPRKLAKSKENLTEQEQKSYMNDFIAAKEAMCKQYGMLTKFEDSKNFLEQHIELVCEETLHYLTVWCLTLEMEGKHDSMAKAARQTMCMRYILESGKHMSVDPRSYMPSFFTKIQDCDPDYGQQFERDIAVLKERIRLQAREKLQDALTDKIMESAVQK